MQVGYFNIKLSARVEAALLYWPTTTHITNHIKEANFGYVQAGTQLNVKPRLRKKMEHSLDLCSLITTFRLNITSQTMENTLRLKVKGQNKEAGNVDGQNENYSHAIVTKISDNKIIIIQVVDIYG
jgi:hypothetical protein